MELGIQVGQLPDKQVHTKPWQRPCGLLALSFLFHHAVELSATHDLHLRIFQCTGDCTSGVNHHMLLANDVFVQLAMNCNFTRTNHSGDLTLLSDKEVVCRQIA